MSKKLRVGTRDSQLAVWQAEHVCKLLAAKGVETEIIFIKSDGEFDLKTPLYEMGVSGIFTKTLDIALLQSRIDIAVHSLKDVPTQIARGLTLATVPKRGNPIDILVYKNELPTAEKAYTAATSSLRRKAQWLHRFPSHRFENLRGNINTRVRKLVENDEWNGAVFAAAGVERIGLEIPKKIDLDWMLPAPGQGALAIACRENDRSTIEKIKPLNHEITEITTAAERLFLRTLMGGCSMPIAAFAEIKNDQLHFEGNVLSIDGKEKAEVKMIFEKNNKNAGEIAAKELLKNGGKAIIKNLQKMKA